VVVQADSKLVFIDFGACGYLDESRKLLQLLQIGTTEWDGQDVLRRTAGPGFAEAFQSRPDWLYAVVVVSIALFMGQLAIHALRRAGVATLLALGVLAFRLAALAVLDAWRPEIGMSFVSHLLLVPPLVVLDVWYASRPASAQTLVGGNLLAGLACLLAAIPAIAYTMPAPLITGEMLAAMFGIGVLMALAAGTAGARLGNWLAALRPSAMRAK
jgi:hypothetical protein